MREQLEGSKTMQLSKSDYMLFLRHPAWLWTKKHQKHLLPPIDPSLQAKFDEGNQFEAYVESLFPNLTRLGFENYSDYLNLPAQTENAWEHGAEIVSQGRYEHERLTCISDLVRKDKDGFILTEIKSSTKAKEEHTLDLGFQKVVMELCGFPIIKCEVAHVNKHYTLNGPINPDELVNFTDITSEVESLIQITKERIDRAINVIDSSQMPDPSPAKARLKSFDDWMEIRKKIPPELPKNSIYFLPFMDAEKSTDLIKQDIEIVEDINDVSVLKTSTQKYLVAKSEGKRIVEKDMLRGFLSEIKYPVYYFDYETSQSLIPPWEGTRPYQQVPFQFSLHILRGPNENVEHVEYLHRDTTNPMPALIESLKKNIGDKGSILVWHQSFEKTRNNEMGEIFQKSAKFLKQINDRILDLKIPFSKGIIRDPEFMGSSSIKKVLPALTKLSYDNLDVQEGGTASRLWKEITLDNPSSPQREKVYADLVEYCTLDTWAMVEIHRELVRLAS